MDENKRCNLEKTENGVRVCWGNHDKALGCEWEYFVSEGYSRRPELDGQSLWDEIEKTCSGRGITLSRGNISIIRDAICAKFTAPEAKQREVKWPEKVDLTGFKDGYGKGSRDHIIAAAWNQAIDACKKAYEEAQPSSPVNAELRSALEECISVMLENDEYGWSDDAIKQAEQALNSIKSGKDTKCS